MNPPNMNTLEARLASFEKAKAGPKRRNSSTKGAKGAKWPHASPSSVDLARSGFFFKPTASAPDNVQCFSCEKELDGWDEEDVAILEHRQLSPACGFALNLGIEYDIEHDQFEPNDTDSVKTLDARKTTFKDQWPHENKRGWTCKTQKMAEGGWYYCPTPENDDMVKCAYCGLSLDGWEPKDNPLHEHQRRAPDCLFFSLAHRNPTKSSRAGRGRPSKASRMSIQSNTTLQIIDDPLESDDSVMTNMSTHSTVSKATKKAAKGRKPRTQTKEVAKPKAKEDHDIQDIDMGEPEDAGFDIVTPMPVSKPKRGKKRSSEEMISVDQQHAANQDTVPEPPPKRRATRVRSSTVKSEQLPIVEGAERNEDHDAIMIGKESLAVEQPGRSRKGVKATRKRASSTVRKASNASVQKASNTSAASKAALRATRPTDDEVDAALAADLERPLTDEENEQQELAEHDATVHRLTRIKPGSRNTSRFRVGSVAPTRKTARASTESLEAHLRRHVSEEARHEPEQETSTPSLDVQILGAESKKGRKGAKAKNSNSVKRSQNTSIVVSSAANSERPMSEAFCSLDNSTSMQHHGVAANISPDIPTATGDNSPTEVKDISSQVSLESVGRKRSISHNTVKEVEEEPAKARKTVIKVEIQRTSRHNKPPTESVHGDFLTSAADDEKEDSKHRGPLPKKLDSQTRKGKTTIAKANVVSHPRPSSAKVIPKHHSPVAVTHTVTPKNIHVHSPAVVINIEQEATHVMEKPLAPHEKLKTPTPSPSPQSSDAENHPPSTRPVEKRPPLIQLSPSKNQTTRVPLAANTPNNSPSKRNAASKIHTDAPWTAIDFENIFSTVKGPEGGLDLALLSSPEKRMTVKEWIFHNATKGEEKLKMECEKMVGAFELEGVKALRSLEGIICVD